MPISVTHPQGKGLTAATLTTAETDGPFAKYKAAAKAAQECSTSNGANESNGSAAAVAAKGAEAQEGSPAPAVEVQHLNFAYPGLGER